MVLKKVTVTLHVNVYRQCALMMQSSSCHSPIWLHVVDLLTCAWMKIARHYELREVIEQAIDGDSGSDIIFLMMNIDILKKYTPMLPYIHW